MGTAGRLVIPKRLREAAGLRDGVPVEVRLRDGKIEVEAAPAEYRIEKHGRVHVLVPVEPGEPLTSEDVARVLERVRNGEERGL
jgi:AbrB family looped-hinge helix DNA binding protein